MIRYLAERSRRSGFRVLQGERVPDADFEFRETDPEFDQLASRILCSLNGYAMEAAGFTLAGEDYVLYVLIDKVKGLDSLSAPRSPGELMSAHGSGFLGQVIIVFGLPSLKPRWFEYSRKW